MESAARSRARAAMRATPRSLFLPPDQVEWADDDRPLPIGDGQTSSQPTTVCDMLELLDVRAGQRVLDVGSGSGWTTAILAELVGPSGSVLGLEVRPHLVAFGARCLEAAGRPWAGIDAARPGTLGAPDRAPFDRILVSAQGPQVPRRLVDQLAENGILVAPAGGRLVRVRMTGRGPRTERFGHYAFVPLVE